MTEETLGTDSVCVTDSTIEPNLRSSTRQLIRACTDPAFDAKYKWEVLLHHYGAAEVLSRHAHPDFDPDEVGEVSADLAAALMDTPAPDAAALRWKLDRALRPDQNGGVTPWAESYVRQTIADCRRMLDEDRPGEAAKSSPSQRRLEWDAALDRLRAAEAILESAPTDDAADDVNKAELAMLETRTPDLPALKVKIERLRGISDGSDIRPDDFDRLLADVSCLGEA